MIEFRTFRSFSEYRYCNFPAIIVKCRTMENLLEKIDSPADLKQLKPEQLKPLAHEIRDFILNSMSKTGGHLASNLGVIELTLALHYVFDFANDKLVWDVGHQCYTHKIITGRKQLFYKLRQADGISGFPNPNESLYDPFVVGHAGTSIATGIGMALGAKQTGSEEKIVSLVGDASIVNGLSFEALNNLGLVKRQMLIVLNDNSMAIDRTQGALAKYFSQIRLSQTYEDLRKTTTNILDHLPVIGKGVEEAIERIKKQIRMTLPASQMFESLDIPYFGPVDGHDVVSMVQLFEAVRHLHHPVILHVYTEKGRGFEPADKNPRKFHSTGPFNLNGEPMELEQTPGRRSTDTPTFTKVFGSALVSLAENDKRIVAITSAMCDGTGLAEFRKRFPDRYYDVGIAESAAVDIAAGLAKTGFKPVVCIYSTFLQRAFDQIFQEVSLQNLPVVFCVDRAGFVGSDGPTHHGLMDIGFLRMMPNMVLTAPADAEELPMALEFALNENTPAVIRYPKDLVPTLQRLKNINSEATKEPFIRGQSVTVISNPNAQLAIVNYGSLLYEACKAAEILSAEDLEVDVINARFAAPLNNGIIELARDKAIITIEDHGLSCGFGSAILEAVANKYPGGVYKPIITLAAERKFTGHDLRRNQLSTAKLNADNIVQRVKRCLQTMRI